MGAEMSRDETLPEGIDTQEVRDLIRKRWTQDEVLKDENNSHQGDIYKTTQKSSNIILASQIFNQFVMSERDKLNVLEIMSGNCAASEIFRMCNQYIRTMVSTDIIDYETRKQIDGIVFERRDPIDAIERFGREADVLLVISPPPASKEFMDTENFCGYADYYAYHDFIEQTLEGETKYIVVVGELGASDGSIGTYKYLTEHPYLTLKVREILEESSNGFGGLIQKEIFIFEIDKY